MGLSDMQWEAVEAWFPGAETVADPGPEGTQPDPAAGDGPDPVAQTGLAPRWERRQRDLDLVAA